MRFLNKVGASKSIRLKDGYTAEETKQEARPKGDKEFWFDLFHQGDKVGNANFMTLQDGLGYGGGHVTVPSKPTSVSMKLHKEMKEHLFPSEFGEGGILDITPVKGKFIAQVLSHLLVEGRGMPNFAEPFEIDHRISEMMDQYSLWDDVEVVVEAKPMSDKERHALNLQKAREQGGGGKVMTDRERYLKNLGEKSWRW